MSSVVCQGLQSCLEPRLVEPRVLRHKLSQPNSKICQPLPSSEKPNFKGHLHAENSHNDNNNNNDDDDDNESNHKSSKNGRKGGWSFIQALINPSNYAKEVIDKNEKVYVHPLVKRSASALSSKSLEMCTESLGSETGSDISSDEFSSLSWEGEKMQLPNDEFSTLSWEKEKMQLQNDDEFSSLSWETKNKNSSNCREFTKKLNFSRSFPPPLTSISGSDSVQVRPHREGGRLVIKAVTISSCHTYFQADRTNGRLKLSLLKECSVNSDCDTNEEDEEEVLKHEHDNEITGEEVEEEEGDEVCWGEDMDGNGRKVGDEAGIQELQRLSRCKEGFKSPIIFGVSSPVACYACNATCPTCSFF